MSSKMKILIGYDGKNSSAKWIDHLKDACFPPQVEVVVLCAADVFVPPSAGSGEISWVPTSAAYLEGLCEAAQKQTKKTLEIAEKTAAQGAAKIKKAFPSWKVSSQAAADSPGWALVKKAQSWKADLVVVGSHNQPRPVKFFLGSTAQQVAMEAPCSVRVLRGEAERGKAPLRIVIAADGSKHAERAVNAAASRRWPKGSSAHLVIVKDTRMLTDVLYAESAARRWISKQDRQAADWIQKMTETYGKKLRACGLNISVLIKEGDPKKVILEEAEHWGADCIFSGARGLNLVERLLIGSVSASLISRAHCTVEIVRR